MSSSTFHTVMAQSTYPALLEIGVIDLPMLARNLRHAFRRRVSAAFFACSPAATGVAMLHSSVT
jgi:hypothetical protein